MTAAVVVVDDIWSKSVGEKNFAMQKSNKIFHQMFDREKVLTQIDQVSPATNLTLSWEELF